MASTRIKGITVEIGGDTTGLNDALKGVNKEIKNTQSQLHDVEKLLKLDPGNVELLSQRQRLLTDAISETNTKLETLRTAASQAEQALANGQISQDKYDALKREIIDTEQQLNKLQTAADDTANRLDDFGREARDTAGDLDELGSAAQNAEADMDGLDKLSGNGLKVLAGGVAAGAGALIAAAESSREYREDMAKLDTAFEQSGFSADAAYAAYSQLVSVMGESDTAVEAANHLAQLTDNEKDLSTWTGDILPGVFATFGDSLPLEGLTEAANETAKVGSVTGSLADALNWVGISEDDFNAKLEACTTEQERQSLITSTLAGAYAETSAAYQQTAGDVMSANAANEAWRASIAQLGEVIDPIWAKMKELAAELIERLVPVVEWFSQNLPTLAGILGTIGASLAAFKLSILVTTLGGLPGVIGAVKTAVIGLNAAMLANPIGLIVAAIGLIVTAFVTLWNNCEGFRNFWIGLWEGIKTAVSTAVTWIGQTIAAIPEFFASIPGKVQTAFSTGMQGIQAFFTNLWQGILDNPIVQLVIDNLSTAWTNFTTTISNIWNGIKEIAAGVWELIKNVVLAPVILLIDLLTGNFEGLKEDATAIWNNIKDAASMIWNGIKDTVSAIVTGFVEGVKTLFENFKNGVVSIFTALKDGVVNIWNAMKSAVQTVMTFFTETIPNAFQNMVQAIKEKVSAIKQHVVDGFNRAAEAIRNLPAKFKEYGQNIIQGIIDGIVSKFKALKQKITDTANSVKNTFKSILGISSPSKVFAQFGKYVMEGLGIGIDGGLSDTLKSIKKAAGDVIEQFTESLGLKSAEKVIKKDASSVAEAASDSAYSAIEDTTDKFKETQSKALKESVEETKSTLSAMESEYESAISAIQSKISNMASKMVDFELFSINSRGKLKLTDLDKQLASIDGYNSAIEQLKARGASDSLLSRIAEMDMGEATQYSKALLRLDDSEFYAYMSKYEEIQERATAAANAFYQEEMDAAERYYGSRISDLQDEVTDSIEESTDSVEGTISDSADSVEGTVTATSGNIVTALTNILATLCKIEGNIIENLTSTSEEESSGGGSSSTSTTAEKVATAAKTAAGAAISGATGGMAGLISYGVGKLVDGIASTVTHTGTITVQGTSDEGVVNKVVDIVTDNLKKAVRA